jgi:hypothetical protein
MVSRPNSGTWATFGGNAMSYVTLAALLYWQPEFAVRFAVNVER